MTALASPPSRTLIMRSGNLAALRDFSSKEILYDGAAGTGKSTSLLAKLYIACTHPDYPNVRCLLLRKTRSSLTESGLVTFERDILAGRLGQFGKTARTQRHSYNFANGSTIVVGGLDDVGKIMSADYDLIAVMEATECEEDEIEMLTTRLRNGAYACQQLVMDCNPSYPQHWLNQRCIRGRTIRYKSHLEDNPKWFDWDSQAWTPAGREYVEEVLMKLNGPRRARLYEGKWVQAEGVIYEGWNEKIHVKDTLPNGELLPPEGWPVQLWVDFGYSARHPMVILWATQDPKGNWWIYRELHESNRLVEDIAKEAREWCQKDGFFVEREGERARKPNRCVCDHDLEDRKTLERYLGMTTTAARKDVMAGIQAVAKRLVVNPKTGEPSFYVLRNALVRRDPFIAELKRPCSLAEEMDSYIWSDNVKKDEPVKDMDDACDAGRYGIFFNDRVYARGWRLERI